MNNKNISLLLLLAFLSATSFSQEHITISGYLTDASNGEALLFGNIYIVGTTTGVNSNEYGFYSIDVPKGETVDLVYSYIGYEAVKRTINQDLSKTIHVKLQPAGAVLEAVEIVAKKEGTGKEEVRSTQTSTIHLQVQDLKSIPSLAGEVDIIKVAQLMPGISKGGEGSTDMFVRGGDTDQNLVLLDEATVYNIGHLLGFFSIFNPDALKDLSITKGGFPAFYGGRLSSVLDVRMKEGNNQSFQAEGGIGLLSSRLTVEAPIVKDRSSFLLSGRRTYIDQLLSSDNYKFPYYFYDLNAKVNYKISDNDRIFLSEYFGDDVVEGTIALPSVSPSDSLVVTLSNINEDYFRFLEARKNADNFFNLLTKEPISSPSNISGGLGFFNTHFPDIRFFDLNDY